MPFVSGFLRVRRRGHPDTGLPEPEGEVDPGYGIEEHPPHVGGGPIYPDVDPPDPPPGLWPPLTPEHPWRPIDPGWGRPERPPVVGGGPARPPGLPPVVGGGPARPERPTDPDYGIDEGSPPPGTIWPPLPVHDGKFWALALIGGFPGGPRYRYVVVDASLRPGHDLPRPPARPDNTLPPSEAQPKQ